MTTLLILLAGVLFTLLLLAVLAFLLGFRLGGDHWFDELTRVRLESAKAERQLHDLTRQAFISMAKRAEEQHHPDRR